METDASRPSPAEAAAALRDIEQAQSSVASARAPWWFFVALAGLLAPIPLVQLAPDPPLGVFVLLGAVVVWAFAFGVLIRVMVNRVGVVHRVRGRAAWIAMSPVLALAIVAIVLYLAFDARWAPTAFDELIAVTLLAYGIRLSAARHE
jgi:hypothetical protein